MFDIVNVTAPFEAEETRIPVLPMKAEVPSVSCVKDPDNPCGNFEVPRTLLIPAEFPTFIVVAAAAKFNVVTLVLMRSNVAAAVLILAEIEPSPTRRM